VEVQDTYRDALVIGAVEESTMVKEKLGSFDVFDRVERGVPIIIGQIDIAT
jgi:hypothetical protein